MATSTIMTANILKKLVLGVAVGAVSLVSMKANPANAASFNFSFVWNYNQQEYGTGSVEGFDNDSDGLLTKNELTSFNTSLPLEGAYLNLNDLFGFGSFDLNTGVWNADAPGWGQPNLAWFSWNGGGNSVNPLWATMTTNDYVPTPPTPPATVPEPASTFGLLALGAMGAGSMLKRKQQQKATVKA
ncbi:PEP-CTERM sorting domain-containing protein [Trichocoleus sp. DQ-A3]|uniref:PEP-CTERM sorting domain-containing protein n=1 Tax=Cyanophyceae TaxID=3028117 RepID=UPI0018EF9C86|nr:MULTISPECIES: PEP-CTERM sorting domain-containing protein [unclassified Coleofasciculus]